MSKSFYFYSPLSVEDLKLLVEKVETTFDDILDNLEGHPYLSAQENLISHLANVVPGPILPELTLDDFDIEDGRRLEMEKLFQGAHSCLCLEDVPYLSANPFQVTWLKILIDSLRVALVDTGGVTPVKNLQDFALELAKNRDLFEVTKGTVRVEEKLPQGPKKSFLPVEPLDFVLKDIYKELNRLSSEEKLIQIQSTVETNEKMKKLFIVLKNNFQNVEFNSSELLPRTGLHPKDFGDFLERLKFLLKRS